MKSMVIFMLCLGIAYLINAQSPGGTSMLQSQFVNPCGNDGANEFIISTTGTSTVNINDLALASIDPSNGTQPNFNFYWRGDNVVQEPKDAFTPNTESCGNSGLECYGIADPNIPAEVSIINMRISALNTAAGCTIFLPVPTNGNIPANSSFIFFLGSYNCNFDNIITNLNFSNHCAGGNQYYAVFGFGDGGAISSAPCSNPGSGYFSNSENRTSITFVYNGGMGGNTNPANYITNSVTYDPGTGPSGGNAGWVNPIGSWVNNQSCIPMASQLPITLLYFNGYVNNKSILLKWHTASEINNAYMAVERSKDGVNFVELGRVKGHGTTRLPQVYSFIDEQPLRGINYYRLRQVDKDEKIEYHKIIAVAYHEKEANINMQLYPTQVNDVLNIVFNKTLNESGMLYVTDLAGRILQQEQIEIGTENLTIDVNRLPQGMYFLRMQSERTFETLRFMKF